MKVCGTDLLGVQRTRRVAAANTGPHPYEIFLVDIRAERRALPHGGDAAGDGFPLSYSWRRADMGWICMARRAGK